MPLQAPNGFQQLGDDGTDSESWPQKIQLMELMDERESGGLRLLSDLTGGGGAGKLASMLGSSADSGLSGEAADLEHRKVLFGANAFREKVSGLTPSYPQWPRDTAAISCFRGAS